MGFAIASAGLLLFTWLYLYSKQRSNGLTPPGPPAYPIIGNLFDMPSKNQVKVFSRLASEYGSILYLNVIGQPIIIVSDIEVARDLLEKRSNVYSDRPTMRMAGEMVGWENTLVLQHYGPTFRAYRKHLFRIFGTRAQIEGFNPVFETAAHNMLADLLRRPKNFPEAFRRAAGAIILKIAYGYNIREGSDEFVARIEEAMVQFSKLFEAGGYLVDYIPFLKYLPEWFPGASFQKTAREYRTTLMNMADMPMDLVKNQIASGTAARSLVADEINEGSVKTEEDEHILKWTAASIYTGGTDTTFSAMQTFMLTMTLYPDAQKKAQREIDAVIGRERLLTMADRSRLPYVNALHSEVLRWSSVVPLGMPHRLTEDDVYNGFAFPKGTIIIPNIWHMLHDPEVYKNPMDFNPDRFIESPGHAAEQDPRLAIFGFGRRICPGLTLADATTWLECALILSTFSISKARDARGEEITPSAKYLDGTITLPQAFECEIKPRSPETEALIHALG